MISYIHTDFGPAHLLVGSQWDDDGFDRPCRMEFTVQNGNGELGEMKVVLGVDEVAALIGQLQSWLKRQEAKVEA